MKHLNLRLLLLFTLFNLPVLLAVPNIDELRAEAEKGDVKAQFILGLMYNSGSGVSQDLAVAVNWCRKAAEQGNATAQAQLGEAYKHGRGVPSVVFAI